ncbi:MAG: hypothetical protein ACTHJT_10330 [Cytophaga sp.]|uniref:hypothetical protein n=1 Tax=Cytophaga sp. TaxID=29535 RepID=UPI003F8058AA
MRIHAICLALNEDGFIREVISALYPFCSGISLITQYDRDWYGKPVIPDQTVPFVMNFPDPEGKIHVVIRRYKDEAAARNHEMQAILHDPTKGILTHGVPIEEVKAFHQKPDYFLIVDGDEIYDPETFPNIIKYLEKHKPRGLRVNGYNYYGTWNQRLNPAKKKFCHFGFIKPGILFETRRRVSWNEVRLAKLLKTLKLKDVSHKFFGFMECPEEVGVFHHASYVGPLERIASKLSKSSHPEVNNNEYLQKVIAMDTEFIPYDQLPAVIRNAKWPEGYIVK